MLYDSFIRGYEHGLQCKQELTLREIERDHAPVDSVAFAQGLLDALRGDSWRYDRLKIRQILNEEPQS